MDSRSFGLTRASPGSSRSLVDQSGEGQAVLSFLVHLDPNCGWARGKADVLYVADAFAVMGKVNELLAAKK